MSSSPVCQSSIYRRSSSQLFGLSSYLATSSQKEFGILPLDFSTTDSQASSSSSSSISADETEALSQQSVLLSSNASINDEELDEAAPTDPDEEDDDGRCQASEPAAPLSVSLLRQLGISPGIMQCMKAELPIYDSCDLVGNYSSGETAAQPPDSPPAARLRPLTVVRPRVTCLRYARPLRLLTFG